MAKEVLVEKIAEKEGIREVPVEKILVPEIVEKEVIKGKFPSRRL